MQNNDYPNPGFVTIKTKFTAQLRICSREKLRGSANYIFWVNSGYNMTVL